jgi:hypothetical protein
VTVSAAEAAGAAVTVTVGPGTVRVFHWVMVLVTVRVCCSTTVFVGAGAAWPCEAHAARLRPAVSATAGIAITLLSFIVLPPLVQSASCHFLLTGAYESYTLAPRGEMTKKLEVNVT